MKFSEPFPSARARLARRSDASVTRRTCAIAPSEFTLTSVPLGRTDSRLFICRDNYHRSFIKPGNELVAHVTALAAAAACYKTTRRTYKRERASPSEATGFNERTFYIV